MATATATANMESTDDMAETENDTAMDTAKKTKPNSHLLKTPLRTATFAFASLLCTTILFGCGSTKESTGNKKCAEANRLAAMGDYANAVSLYKEMDNAQTTLDSASLRLATIAAQATGENTLACKWGYAYSSKGDTAKLDALAKSLVALGRNDDRATLIEDNKPIFNHLLGSQNVSTTLTDFYAKNNSPKIKETFPELADPQLKAKYFASYFPHVKNDMPEAQAEKLCAEIIKQDKDNITAIEYVAKIKYDRAEKKFKSAYADYEKHNKTTAAHAYLARDLKQVSGEYRNCKSLFEKLHKMQPDNKSYIKYLININLRLENKTEAKRLEKLL